jgi:glutathione S-transferase
MIELYQAEWCPHSHRVRERLTELGLDFVARQVSPDPGQRAQMRRATGEGSIPTLVDGEHVFSGDEAILAYLDGAYEEPPEAAGHRAKDAEEGPAWRG